MLKSILKRMSNTRIPVMKFIKNLKLSYQLKQLATHLHEVDMAQDDNINVALSKALKIIHQTKDAIASDHELKKELLFTQNNDEQSFVFLANRAKFLVKFVEMDFEDAFNGAYTLAVTAQSLVHRANFSLSALEALEQIKIDYLDTDNWIAYKSKYQTCEQTLFDLCENILSNSDIVGKHGSLTINNYNSLRMAFARLAWLDGNQTAALELIHAQVQQYGKERVEQIETEHSGQQWYFDTVNHEKLTQWEHFLITQLNPQVKRKNKR